jgi:hypothetical protein
MPGEMGRISWGIYYVAYIFMDLRSVINSNHRILRGTQSSQLNGEPRNYFLRRDPKTDKTGH